MMWWRLLFLIFLQRSVHCAHPACCLFFLRLQVPLMASALRWCVLAQTVSLPPSPTAVSELAAAAKVEQSCACTLGAATCEKSKAIRHVVPPRLVVESYIYIYILCILYMREKGRVQVGIIMLVCVCVCACVNVPPSFFKWAHSSARAWVDLPLRWSISLVTSYVSQSEHSVSAGTEVSLSVALSGICCACVSPKQLWRRQSSFLPEFGECICWWSA